MTTRKLAILSNVLPPSPSGQAMVLYRLLSPIDPDEYYLMSFKDYEHDSGESIASARLPAHYYHLETTAPPYAPPLVLPVHSGNRIVRAVRTRYRQWKTLRDWVSQLNREVLFRAEQIQHIMRQDPCYALIACTGDPYDLPAGALACQREKIPFIPYIFDDYAYQWTGEMRRQLSLPTEPRVMRQAHHVLVTNEVTAQEYHQRYGVARTVLHNPCPVGPLSERSQPAVPDPARPVRIVYTGSIYHAHFDAFRNLLAAIERLDNPGATLHLYSNQPESFIAANGVAGPHVIHHGHVPHTEITAVLDQADILFLPLAFESEIPQVLKLSSPGKMGEYLAANRPILVHAPAGSFVSTYFRQHNCGMVVDQNDVDLLARTLDQLIHDPTLQAELGRRAYQRARTDFAIDRVQPQFTAFLKRVQQATS